MESPRSIRRAAAVVTVSAMIAVGCGSDPPPDLLPTDHPGAVSQHPAGSGTRDDPYQIGQRFEVGDWEVIVLDVTPDSSAEITGYSTLNYPPDEGEQYFQLVLRATYLGEGAGTASSDIRVGIRGRDGTVVRQTRESFCGMTPNPLTGHDEQYHGATVEGDVCLAVASDHADGALVQLTENTPDSSPVFVVGD